MPKIEYYTDGSCRGNGSANARGAYGYVRVIDNIQDKLYTQAESNTTNQRCELLGVIGACQDALSGYGTFTDIYIYTDSAYIINCYTQKWYDRWLMNGWVNTKKEPVANQDLWKQLIPFFDMVNFNFLKVKGHAGVEFNEIIDEAVQSLSAGEE